MGRLLGPLLPLALILSGSLANPLKGLLDRAKEKKEGKNPAPRVIELFVSPEEARYLLERYEGLMKDSLFADGSTSGSSSSPSSYRTSRSIRLPPLGDSVVFDIERRSAAAAGFNHSYVEDFQMACYEEGQLLGLHRDDADGKINADRSATVLIYLQAPEEGGETIFTRRPLEIERDLDTGQGLRSEEGALKLFRAYCDRPERKFVVVAPTVGTAVVWRNWLGDDLGTFHASSTHGACPPKHGKKCVIQQWISRKHKLELRDERLAALFLAGANAHYQAGGSSSGGEGADTPTVQQCMMDASANEGRAVPRICSGEGTDAVQLDGTTSGPYRGVGALRTSGGFAAELPPGMVGGGVTASLWARDLEPGTTVLSLGPAYLKFRNSSSVRLSFELRAGSEVREMKVFSGKASETWFWFSLSLGGGSDVSASIFSRGKRDASSTIQVDTCGAELERTSGPSRLEIVSPPASGAFVSGQSDGYSSDLSFVLLHSEAIDDPDQLLAFSRAAQRYDKNL